MSLLNLQDLNDFINSSALRKLLSMQSKVTLFDILGKRNSENIHTTMLLWILSTPEFQNIPFPPALLLLQLIFSKGLGRNNLKIEPDYLKYVYINSPDLDVQALSEITFKNRKRIDICVEITINKFAKFRLWIENKLFSVPGLHQLDNYYNSVQAQKKDDGFQDIFVFLSPGIEKAPDHSAYIHITYQELYDKVLLPLREELCDSGDNKVLRYLNEYIDTLLLVDSSFNPIVKSMEYTDCLKEIYDNYRDLFIAAISSCGTDDEKDAVNTISRIYEIKYNDKLEIVTGYTALAQKVFGLLLASGVNRDELLGNLGKLDKVELPGSDYRVADTYDTKGASSCYSTRTVGRPKIYISNQWNAKKADCFIRLVKQHYPDLKIARR